MRLLAIFEYLGTYLIISPVFLGGPLMYLNRSSSRYVLIGTVNGFGYDCGTHRVHMFEDQTDGIWNKVSAHMDWIEDNMKQFGQQICKS